jgi:F-box domain
VQVERVAGQTAGDPVNKEYIGPLSLVISAESSSASIRQPLPCTEYVLPPPKAAFSVEKPISIRPTSRWKILVSESEMSVIFLKDPVSTLSVSIRFRVKSRNQLMSPVFTARFRSSISLLRALPQELVLSIIAEMSAKDILSLAQSCNYFHNLIMDEKSIPHLIRLIEDRHDEEQSRVTGFTLYNLLDPHHEMELKLTFTGCLKRHSRNNFSERMRSHSYLRRVCMTYSELSEIDEVFRAVRRSLRPRREL